MLVKKKRPPIIKRFCEKRGGQKINHTPQNILEGNGVVFEILVKEKDPPHHSKLSCKKQIIHTPQIFLKVIE